MQTYKCIVAALNSNGSPDLFFTKVRCTDEEYNNGDHYDRAFEEANRNGYDAMLVYDETDPGGVALVGLVGLDWERIPTVDMHIYT